jgi:hypothetical protein
MHIEREACGKLLEFKAFNPATQKDGLAVEKSASRKEWIVYGKACFK